MVGIAVAVGMTAGFALQAVSPVMSRNAICAILFN
jgi:hypothetical protein